MTAKSTPDTINSGIADALRGLTDHLKKAAEEGPAQQADMVGESIREATKPRVNQSPPLVSARNPQGDKDYPRPTLRFQKVYMPYEVEPEQLTWEQLELVNLLKKGEYWVTLNDETRQIVKIRVVENDITGAAEKLFMESALFNSENKIRVRPMATMLREIIGKASEDILTMADRRQMVDEGVLAVSVGQ